MARQGRSHSVTVFWAIQIALVTGAFAVVAGFVTFRDYVENSPRFCQTCHNVAPELAIWMESEHREVRCQQCHHQTLEAGLRILQVYVGGGMQDTPHAPVDVTSCAICHASHDDRWPSIANSIGHVVHNERAQIECTTCHGQEMHFARPARSTCTGCHEGKTVGTAHDERHCLACHNFLSTERVIKPQRQDCLHCHRNQARPVIVSATAPMQLVCSACHRPHSAAGVVPCKDCHKPAELVGLHKLAEHSDCADCHQQHEWLATREHCFACHDGLYSHHPDEPCAKCHFFEAALGTGPR